MVKMMSPILGYGREEAADQDARRRIIEFPPLTSAELTPGGWQRVTH
jgi:hypothetical protein